MSFGQCLLFSARNSESCFVCIVAGKYTLVDMQLEFLLFSVFQRNVSRCLSVCLLNPFVMAALRSRCGHYIFALWFLLSSFFPCLISTIADWMYTILPHMVWPYANLRCRSETCCTRMGPRNHVLDGGPEALRDVPMATNF